MRDYHRIAGPTHKDDQEGAQRVFEEFLTLYQPTLAKIEQQLDKITDETGCRYASAYEPWRKAVHDLLRGVFLLAKKIPLPDTEALLDAVRMFRFESAIRFLTDLCVSCKITLKHNWAQTFREHIDILLFAVSIRTRQMQEPCMQR